MIRPRPRLSQIVAGVRKDVDDCRRGSSYDEQAEAVSTHYNLNCCDNRKSGPDRYGGEHDTGSTESSPRHGGGGGIGAGYGAGRLRELLRLPEGQLHDRWRRVDWTGGQCGLCWEQCVGHHEHQWVHAGEADLDGGDQFSVCNWRHAGGHGGFAQQRVPVCGFRADDRSPRGGRLWLYCGQRWRAVGAERWLRDGVAEFGGGDGRFSGCQLAGRRDGQRYYCRESGNDYGLRAQCDERTDYIGDAAALWASDGVDCVGVEGGAVGAVYFGGAGDRWRVYVSVHYFNGADRHAGADHLQLGRSV